jgi:hypothetical protein
MLPVKGIQWPLILHYINQSGQYSPVDERNRHRECKESTRRAVTVTVLKFKELTF